MGYLEREFLIHDTDEKGKVLPIDYPCPELGGRTLRVQPAKRGRTLRMANDATTARKLNDIKREKMILCEYAAEHILDPKNNKPLFTPGQLAGSSKSIRYTDKVGVLRIYDPYDLFVSIIHKISGVDVKEEDRVKAVEKTEGEVKKKPSN